MTITSWDIYWITRLDNLRTTIILLIVGSLLIISGAILGWLIEDSEAAKGSDREKEARRHVRMWVPRYIIILLLLCILPFVPTTKEACAILAIPIVVNNEEVQDLPKKVVGLANEWIDELRPNTSDSNEGR